jgi:hypothetical protein
MGIISRLPGVGLYVHMLSKVMMTVLNFFATYFWTFLGYAIAFHILLPSDGPYGKFGDAFIKVSYYISLGGAANLILLPNTKPGTYNFLLKKSKNTKPIETVNCKT